MGCLLERDMMMKTLKEVIEFETIRDDIEFAYAAADARIFAKQEVGRQPRRDRQPRPIYHFLKGNNISNKAVSSSSTIQLNPILISIADSLFCHTR